MNKVRSLFSLFFILIACSDSIQEGYRSDKLLLGQMVSVLEEQAATLTREIVVLADYMDSLVRNKEAILSQDLSDPYLMKGPFSSIPTLGDTARSTVILLNSTDDYEAGLKEIKLTNSMDSVFANLYSNYVNIAQVYFNSANQVSRVYPSYDVVNMVDPNIDVTGFNFYYEADEEHNPEKGPVWIQEPYVDPAGKGWILSLVHPVYDGDELFAVIGIDVTVDEIIQNFFDNYEGSFLIVNRKGDIVAGTSSAIESLSMPPLKNHVYRETINADYFRITDFNLFNSKSREVRKMASRFLIEGQDLFPFVEESYLQNAVCQRFEDIDWFMLKINPRIK
ncbi:PDC sensor domain-containing protein [Algoriphagus limi]|uniref:PDC sensor domain-containing protein n=1 Tax=Algoriphagus limi TaxID=2975273 RepID=A0ABT2G354_9BACT|nr:PDC sensor domain-containing protein [Algoriphagus limi]MCS5489691.1 PDC sensor domain-containing protein [Algoriphagus limi]